MKLTTKTVAPGLGQIFQPRPQELSGLGAVAKALLSASTLLINIVIRGRLKTGDGAKLEASEIVKIDLTTLTEADFDAVTDVVKVTGSKDARTTWNLKRSRTAQQVTDGVSEYLHYDEDDNPIPLSILDLMDRITASSLQAQVDGTLGTIAEVVIHQDANAIYLVEAVGGLDADLDITGFSAVAEFEGSSLQFME